MRQNCIAGTEQQWISSCLNLLDHLLTSTKPIVSSMVVAQKHTYDNKDLLQSVLHIMGIRDLKLVSKQSTLAENGMDSLMVVEIKQVLERDLEINMTTSELRALTFGKLQELSESREGGKPIKFQKFENTQNLLIQTLGDEKMANEILTPLNVTDENRSSDTCALFIPGVEGVISPTLSTQCKNIEIPVYALQCHAHCRIETFSELISTIAKSVLELFKNKKKFILIGHSFGAVLEIKIAKLLEQHGLMGCVIAADGAVTLFQQYMRMHIPQLDNMDESNQHYIFKQLVFVILPDLELEEIQKVLTEKKTFEDRADAFLEMVPNSEYSQLYLKNICYGLLNRMKMILNENDKCEIGERIRSNITLIRPNIHMVPFSQNDYNLKQYTDGEVTVSFVEGNHLSMLDNPKFYAIVNNICQTNKL